MLWTPADGMASGDVVAPLCVCVCVFFSFFFQGYLRTLDFKRWLTSVDPTGGCLEYLPAMQIHGTLEQIMETPLDR